MKRQLLFGMAIAVCCLGRSLHANEYCFPTCSQPSLTVSAEALFLDRDQNYNGVLAINETTSTAALTGSDLDYDTVAGTRFYIGREFASGFGLEGIYFGLQDWSADALTVGANDRSLPGDAGLATTDFFAADAIGINLGSKIHNVEVNATKSCGNFTALAGFRFFELNEDMTMSSFDADTFQSDYRINTSNQLYGGQLGGRYRETFNCWSFAIEGKAGVFGNSAKNSTLFRDVANTVTLRDVQNSTSQAAFVGDLRFTADYAITESVYVTAGYNLLWATDLALAPYQVDFTDTPSSSQFINSSHAAFFHGASVGIVARF